MILRDPLHDVLRLFAPIGGRGWLFRLDRSCPAAPILTLQLARRDHSADGLAYVPLSGPLGIPVPNAEEWLTELAALALAARDELKPSASESEALK